MSDAPQVVSRRARLARVIATVVTALLGGALLLQGLFGSGPSSGKLAAIGAGAAVVFIALALSARYVVRPLASVIGYPIARLFSVPGELARENALRQPARTAVTASALMIGVGLVVFVAVLAAGMKDSFGAKIDEQVKADMLVYSEGFEPIPAATERAAARVPGVSGVTALLFDQIEVNGRKANLLYDSMLSVTPDQLRKTYRFDWVEGDDDTLAGLGRGEALVEEQFARAHKVDVGDRYRVVTPSRGRATLRAIGIYKDPTLLQGTLVTPATLKAISTARDPYTLLIAVSPSADATQVQKRVTRALAAFPTADVQSRAEYRQTLEDRLNQIVYLLYALLAMSVVISLFGIANSLFLSISERTREFGLLRAVGTTGSQIRRVVRYESVITSVIGGVLGVAVGVAFAWLTTQSLDEWDLGFTLPPGQLVLVLVLAVIVGVLGAVIPARRGARVSVLEAIHYE